MGGTKIIVVQMKEIIKTVIFAVVGLIAILLLAYFLFPKDAPTKEQSSSLYYPGTYSSEIILHNEPVAVEVTVTEDEISAIEIQDLSQTQEVFYPLFEPTMEELSAKIIDAQSLDVTLSSDNAVTEEILLSAVRDALVEATAY